MTRFVLAAVVVALGVQPSLAAPKKKRPPKVKPEKPDKQTPEQRTADKHFKSGVALFKENKYAEALAEFERAFEIAPHPLVLYNIAGCHRELSHYAEAVKFYNRFLAEGQGQVPEARLTAAQSELDGILARIARVTITFKPAEDVTLTVDGTALDKIEMPLILPPGEHKVVARAPGRSDAAKTLKLASGDELSVELALAELPKEPEKEVVVEVPVPVKVANAKPKRFSLGAGFGTNLRNISESGAPSLGLHAAIGSRVELGVDGILVAYAVMPSLRIRLVGEAFSIHLIGAAPIAFTDGEMKSTFVAGAGGLGVRIRATPALAFRLESFASFAGKGHGTTVPTFLGGELWF